MSERSASDKAALIQDLGMPPVAEPLPTSKRILPGPFVVKGLPSGDVNTGTASREALVQAIYELAMQRMELANRLHAKGV